MLDLYRLGKGKWVFVCSGRRVPFRGRYQSLVNSPWQLSGSPHVAQTQAAYLSSPRQGSFAE